MTNIVWLSDIHLNHLSEEKRKEFILDVKYTDPTAVIITGDTAESDNSIEYLREIGLTLQKPVYFVNGNHDFYYNSIELIREESQRLSRMSDNVRWLPSAMYGSMMDIDMFGWARNKNGTVTCGWALDKDTLLVGIDGCADHEYGDLENSVELADYKYIHEFSNLPKKNRVAAQRRVANEDAKQIKYALYGIDHKNVIIATHVPPFEEACWHEGQISDHRFLPGFTCKAVGDAIKETAEENPETNYIVLCGHTHGQGVYRPLPNLTVWTGSLQSGKCSDYRHPLISFFSIEELINGSFISNS